MREKKPSQTITGSHRYSQIYTETVKFSLHIIIQDLQWLCIVNVSGFHRIQSGLHSSAVIFSLPGFSNGALCHCQLTPQYSVSNGASVSLAYNRGSVFRSTMTIGNCKRGIRFLKETVQSV